MLFRAFIDALCLLSNMWLKVLKVLLKEQLDKVYQLLQNAVTYVRNIATRHPDPDLSNTASKLDEDLYQIHEEIYENQPSLLKQTTKKNEHTLSHRL